MRLLLAIALALQLGACVPKRVAPAASDTSTAVDAGEDVVDGAVDAPAPDADSADSDLPPADVLSDVTDVPEDDGAEIGDGLEASSEDLITSEETTDLDASGDLSADGDVGGTGPCVFPGSAFDGSSGPGTNGVVVICPGDDWWLPEGTPRSPTGVVHVGYGWPTTTHRAADFAHRLSDGALLSSRWSSWEPNADEWSKAFRALLYNVNERDCWENCLREGKINCKGTATTLWGGDVEATLCDATYAQSFPFRKLYLTVFGSVSGSGSPSWLDGLPVPRMLTELNNWCLGNAMCTTCSGCSYGVTYNDPMMTALAEDINDVYPTTYAFWTNAYLDQHKAFLSRLATALTTYDPRNRLTQLHLNGESGFLPSYVKWGFLTRAQIDSVSQMMIQNGVDSGIPVSRFVLNISQGGRAFKAFADQAWQKQMGLATHGGFHLLHEQFLQHNPSICYDEVGHRFSRCQPSQLSHFHADLEYLEKTPIGEVHNAAGQYALFRLLSLSAVALGVNSVLVSANTIPSRGLWQTDNCASSTSGWCAFDWPKVAALGGWEFFLWLNQLIGTSAANSPEAYCNFVSHGVDRDADSTPFLQRIETLKQADDWGEIPSRMGWESDYLRTPRVDYQGHLCTLVAGWQGSRGTPVLRMTPERIGDVEPPLDTWVFGSPTADGNYPYEARSTYSAGQETHNLWFQLDNAFTSARGNAYVIKVTYSGAGLESGDQYQGSGVWRIMLRRSASTGQFLLPIGEVSFSASDGVMTATFAVDDAKLDHSGFYGADLLIQHVSGAHAAFYRVRVIPTN